MQTIFFIQVFFTYPIVGQVINFPQSYIDMSDTGYYFNPVQATDWLDDMFVNSLTECVHQCNENPLCRTFDYNFEPYWCRLFQVEASPERISFNSSFVSQIGYVQLFPDLFSAINQPCDDSSFMTRYLICVDNSFQCPWNTYWDGSTCLTQKYAAAVCTNSNECWDNYYNLTCVSTPICTETGYLTNRCAVNHNLVLWNYTTNTSQPYSFHSFNFIADATAITVTFSLMNQNAFWLLDNISLIDLNTSLSLIQNGDFETGNLTHWNYCNPNSTTNSSRIAPNATLHSESGQYFYRGAPYPYADFLSQTLLTVKGHLHTLSFWFRQSAASTKNRFIVTIFS